MLERELVNLFGVLFWSDLIFVLPALSWKYSVKWKEVLSSVRAMYESWRLEDVKSLIYKLS